MRFFQEQFSGSHSSAGDDLLSHVPATVSEEDNDISNSCSIYRNL